MKKLVPTGTCPYAESKLGNREYVHDCAARGGVVDSVVGICWAPVQRVAVVEKCVVVHTLVCESIVLVQLKKEQNWKILERVYFRC